LVPSLDGGDDFVGVLGPGKGLWVCIGVLQPLPRPVISPKVLALPTLDDVRRLMQKHLPGEYRAKFAWRQLAGGEFFGAACGSPLHRSPHLAAMHRPS
jgi:hypothetical protein